MHGTSWLTEELLAYL